MIAICSFVSLSLLSQDELKLELPKSSPPVFALAKVSQDGKSVAVTKAGGGTRLQTYTVAVPVTRKIKDKDGKETTVTDTRLETRTRSVPVARLVSETFTVMVPVTKQITDKDGTTKNVTEMVPQTRTRTRTVYGNGTGSGKPKLHPIDKCSFRDLKGNPLSSDEVIARLSKKSPIVLLSKGQKLDPFYRRALNQEILLLTLPAEKRNDVPPPEAPVQVRDGARKR